MLNNVTKVFFIFNNRFLTNKATYAHGIGGFIYIIMCNQSFL